MVGRSIAGAYFVQELVGVGGMGRVYRAEQRALGRAVAIKVVHPHLLADEQSVARFYTEARAASRLNHPNSVSIIDFGRTDEGVLYLVMEFLSGKDLSRLAREDGPLPVRRVVDIVGHVLDALGEAHALDVVHRDLKPENVIIERMRAGGDLVKVVDFGLAKLMSGGKNATKVTLPGLVCGTPDYMSPEQGRGEDSDSRGDLYSVGVMLFELLTETLPYIADTPTNVVLKHIQSPIPDPREVAPQRAIAAPLAELCMRALAKDPNDRFQTAADMADRLRSVGKDLGVRELPCPGCGRPSPADSRFCASCGSPMREAPSHSATKTLGFRETERSMPARWRHRSEHAGVLVGRDEELALLAEHRAAARGRLVTVLLAGEPGVGRTRLLSALSEQATGEGDLVAAGGPHPTGAPVPYHPIRDLVLSMLGLSWAGLEQLVQDELPDDALLAAGYRELVDPVGVNGSPGRSRAGAVAAVVADVIRKKAPRGGSSRCLLMIDDSHRCDGLSLEVLSALRDHCDGLSVLLVIAGHAGRGSQLPTDCRVVSLRGLNHRQAEAVLAGGGFEGDDGAHPGERLFSPLYVEQLAELGLDLAGQQGALPPRLADALGQRIQRLPVDPQRVLQCVAVLGTRVPAEMVKKLASSSVGEGFDDAIAVLLDRGLLFQHGAVLESVHPFLRELVEGSVPAAARKEMHARALGIVTEAGAPLEVRAHHAYGSGEALSALVLLERMGDLAQQRGDLATATLGYRRALEVARRELLESGESYLEGAIESVSRRLGHVLLRRGDVTGAEGVLREALEYSAPASANRAQIVVVLASVLAAKDRVREAYRYLGQALEIAIQLDSEANQVEVQMAVATLRRGDGNLKGALAALSAAWELMPATDPDRLKRAQLAVQLASVQLELGDAVDPRPALELAERVCRDADAPYLMARLKGLWGQLEQREGKDQRSRVRFAEAADLAEEAGASHLSRRFRMRSRPPTADPVAAG